MADLNGAIRALTDHQQQLDQDGVMVGVSREALDVVMNHLKAPAIATAEDIAGAMHRFHWREQDDEAYTALRARTSPAAWQEWLGQARIAVEMLDPTATPARAEAD